MQFTLVRGEGSDYGIPTAVEAVFHECRLAVVGTRASKADAAASPPHSRSLSCSTPELGAACFKSPVKKLPLRRQISFQEDAYEAITGLLNL
ncbi:hypothetical protein [Paenibacillus periandrae]|uniref:hypothetical protein n=1 Tax=Paenibacillus periandrae TaxID=1761741 RepID=UPI001F08F164|nr:hypothetical protein [Paenibacillus periandrae]